MRVEYSNSRNHMIYSIYIYYRKTESGIFTFGVTILLLLTRHLIVVVFGVAVRLASEIGIHGLAYIRLVSSVGCGYFRHRRRRGKESVKMFSCQIEGDTDDIAGKKSRGNGAIVIVVRWWKLGRV